MSKQTLQEVHIWEYRGRRLEPVEWGLWKDLDRPKHYFLCYRPAGRKGPVVRQWAWAGGPNLTLANLKEHVRKVRSEIEAKKLGRAVSHSAREKLAEYVAELRRLNRSEKHVLDVERDLTRFLDYSQIERLDRISTDAIRVFLHHVSNPTEPDDAAGQQADEEPGRRKPKPRPASPRTQNKILSVISTWLQYGVRQEWLSANAAVSIQKATEDQKHKVFPLPEELEKIVFASAPGDAALYVFLALTGLRWGSAASLDAACLSDEGIRVLTTKRRQEWFLRYDDGCPLWGHDLTKLGGRIFAQPLPRYDEVQAKFTAACNAAGKRFTLHSLRHAFASWLTMMGETTPDIAAWLHHASPVTTERRYSHLRPHGRDRIDENRKRVLTARGRMMERVMER